MPRPSKLESKRTERLCSLIRKGVPRERAARIAGISPTTFHRWMQEGEAGKDRAKREFRLAVLRAEDDLISRSMAAVVDAFAATCPECSQPREADDGPCPECSSTRPAVYVHELRDRTAAARFILPHRFPQEFSTRAEVQATGPGGGPVQVQAEVKVQPLLTDQQIAALGDGQLAEVIAGLVGRVAG